MDDDDEFFDTISVSSGVSRKRFDNKDYLSLSRNTVYHSTIELENMELTALSDSEEANSQNKVSRNRDVKTYKQWRDRVLWFISQILMHSSLIWCMNNTIYLISTLPGLWVK